MLLLSNSLIICQTINTNHLSKEQIDEAYKGLKQGEYLKDRLRDTEGLLKEANAGLKFKDKRIQRLEEANEAITQMYHTIEFECQTAKKIDSMEIRRQRLIIDDFPNQMKKVENKGFWKGAKVGSVVGVGAAIIGILIIK